MKHFRQQYLAYKQLLLLRVPKAEGRYSTVKLA